MGAHLASHLAGLTISCMAMAPWVEIRFLRTGKLWERSHREDSERRRPEDKDFMALPGQHRARPMRTYGSTDLEPRLNSDATRPWVRRTSVRS